MEARFIKALPAPVQWLLVHSYRAILRGAPPPMHWRDAHIWLSPKVPGSARLDDYRPIALGQLDMKLLTGPLHPAHHGGAHTARGGQRLAAGALPGSNTGPPLFMAQRQLQRGRPNYVFSFDARKAFDTAPHGALHLILRHLSVPPDIIDLLLFLHTCARLRIVTAHGLTQPVYMLRGVGRATPRAPAVRAPPGASTQGTGAPPAPAGRSRARPHPGLHRRFAGGGPHAAALRRGRGGGGRVPGDDGHGAQPPQVRHGHHGGGPGLQLRLCPTWKTRGTGYQRRTPSPTWDSSCSRTGSSPCSASTGYAWRQCTTGALTPSRHRKWCRTSSWRSSEG